MSTGRDETPPKGERRRRQDGVPPASSEVIRVRMATTKRRDTKPELLLRSALHRKGLRFFVDRTINGGRRRVDIVFQTERVAIYVDGCFWHSCPKHGSVPKRNTRWWLDKLAANRKRDQNTDATLRADGWTVLRFWEHDDPDEAAEQIYRVVTEIRQRSVRRTRRAAE